jgi:hypothetical protein
MVLQRPFRTLVEAFDEHDASGLTSVRNPEHLQLLHGPHL